jgi:hypothetical protein
VRRRQQGRTLRLAVLKSALFCVRGGKLLTWRDSIAFQVSDKNMSVSVQKMHLHKLLIIAINFQINFKSNSNL